MNKKTYACEINIRKTRKSFPFNHVDILYNTSLSTKNNQINLFKKIEILINFTCSRHRCKLQRCRGCSDKQFQPPSSKIAQTKLFQWKLCHRNLIYFHLFVENCLTHFSPFYFLPYEKLFPIYVFGSHEKLRLNLKDLLLLHKSRWLNYLNTLTKQEKYNILILILHKNVRNSGILHLVC